MSHELSANYLRVKKWRETHSRKAQNRRYYEKHREQKKAKNKHWREAHPDYWHEHDKKRRPEGSAKLRYQIRREQQLASKREYHIHHMFEVSVRGQARYHVPLASSCELCDSTENLNRHHMDYSEPLIIVTLCASCHRYIHKHMLGGEAKT
jgi:hypothetical protein